MRRFESSSQPYRIEFAPRAWAQIGALHAHEYAAVQLALRSVAERAGQTHPQGAAAADAPPVHSLELQALLLTYAVDAAMRTVRLLSLARVSAAGP